MNTSDSRVELVVDLTTLVTSNDVADRVPCGDRGDAPDRRQQRAVAVAQS